VVLLAGLVAVPSRAADEPYGVWLTEERDAAVTISPCLGEDWLLLCGRITWLKDATEADGRPRVDKLNPNPARRDRPVCGLVVIGGLRPAAPRTWDGGSVYNPQDGQIYSADMALLSDATLRVRAYLGVPFFGKTQIWRRAERSAAGIMEYNCRYVRAPPAARPEQRRQPER
jgi:uncharacterized protein (DUF2147 family)